MSILDVRTKIILLFFANYLLITRAMSVYELVLVAVLVGLFIKAGQLKKALLYLVVFVSFWLIDRYLITTLSGNLLSFLSMLAIGGRLMLPCFMAGSYLLATTSLHEFMVGLRKWHVPEPMLLVIAVMFRFLPTIPEDYQHIRRSLMLRGIIMTKRDMICHPVAFFEYVTVPLLMSASRTAQDLTVASLTKSISANPIKTSYKPYQLTWTDGLVWASIVVGVLTIQLGASNL